MKTFFKILKTITKIIICFLLSIFFAGSILIDRMVVGANEETLLLAIFSLAMIPITWAVFFVKSKWYIKILYLLIFFSYILLPFTLPKVNQAWDKDQCYDDGICKEGMVIKYNQKEIIINKESCLKNGWTWDEKEKYCDTY